ncbi:MAG: S41 family peptidase [Planctomycetota bacterium]
MLPDLGLLRVLDVAAAAPVPVHLERAGKEMTVPVALFTGPAQQPEPPWVRFALDQPHGLALFTLDRCTVDATYRKTLADFFAAVHEQGIARIAVDLRANGGGNSQVVDEFLGYLDVDQYTSFGGKVRGSAAAAEQRGGAAAGIVEHAPGPRGNQRRTSTPFRGELLVAVGKHTFSSGNWFAVVVQDNKLGKVVGEPTGNSPSSFGDTLSFTLPHSALSYTLSYKQWVRPDPSRDPAPCLLPDVTVVKTRQHVIDGVDPILVHLRDAAH